MIEKILSEIEEKRSMLNAKQISKTLQKKIQEDFELNFIYDSNAIEGNTLTLQETKVVLEGITIGGKSLREHFEVINHLKAIVYIKEIVKNKEDLSQWQIKSIHSLILKNIDDENAGRYRNTNVRISGAKHIPPDYLKLNDEMLSFIKYYQEDAQKLHPIIRASRVHIFFVGIHPFIDGNGRTARLLMNLELLKNNFLPLNIKNKNKLEYYEALDIAHCDKDYSKFDLLIARYALEAFEDRIALV